jgi:hypothetical protein
MSPYTGHVVGDVARQVLHEYEQFLRDFPQASRLQSDDVRCFALLRARLSAWQATDSSITLDNYFFAWVWILNDRALAAFSRSAPGEAAEALLCAGILLGHAHTCRDFPSNRYVLDEYEDALPSAGTGRPRARTAS